MKLGNSPNSGKSPLFIALAIACFTKAKSCSLTCLNLGHLAVKVCGLEDEPRETEGVGYKVNAPKGKPCTSQKPAKNPMFHICPIKGSVRKG